MLLPITAMYLPFPQNTPFECYSIMSTVMMPLNSPMLGQLVVVGRSVHWKDTWYVDRDTRILRKEKEVKNPG